MLIMDLTAEHAVSPRLEVMARAAAEALTGAPTDWEALPEKVRQVHRQVVLAVHQADRLAAD